MTTVRYHSKLVGVTFDGRQEVIAKLKGDEPLRVRREADNQYDKQAVAVDVNIGGIWQPIGYIAKDKNKEISEQLDANNTVLIGIGGITGGGKKTYGVNTLISYEKEDKPVVLKAGQEKVMYTSPLTGLSTEVVKSPGGHITIPGYLSGSKFPDQFYPEFDSKQALENIIKAYPEAEGREEEILAMWKLNNAASTGFGSAVHTAMENYDKNRELGNIIGKESDPNKALSKTPIIKAIVEWFHEGREKETVITEPFIWNHDFKLCGSIDRLKIVDAKKNIVRIQDYKTDGDMMGKKYMNTGCLFHKKILGENGKPDNTLLTLHRLQLSFYAFILEQEGFTVEGTDVFWLNSTKLIKGENPWETYSNDVIDIREAILG